MNLKQICEIVNVNKIRELPTHYIIYSKNIKIWINKEENKHEYKINQNILIGAFKELFIELVITESEKKKKQSI